MYWMSRDQRLHDNHAVLYAQALAAEKSVPLRIVFNLHTTPNHDWGTLRAYGFMLRGLREVEAGSHVVVVRGCMCGSDDNPNLLP